MYRKLQHHAQLEAICEELVLSVSGKQHLTFEGFMKQRSERVTALCLALSVTTIWDKTKKKAMRFRKSEV